MDAMNINIGIAFGAGLLSFFSPCVLPLYPSYLSYITGISVDQLRDDFSKKEIRNRALLHTLFFVLGFSIIFVSLGFAASIIGDLFYVYQDLVREIGAILIIFMGLFIAGWLQRKLLNFVLIGLFVIGWYQSAYFTMAVFAALFLLNVFGMIRWDWLMKEKRLDIKNKPAGYLGSTFIGIGFAAGWTPCIGPILAMILTLAASNPSKGVLMLTTYSVGFAIPFFVMAFFVSTTKWLVKYSNKLMKIGGVLLLLIGVLLYTNQMAKITVYLTKWFGTSWLG